ncbi:25S rRNA (uridine(2843)-N(3))-methyltransferase [[Candida] railenensis]|uniref:25S rRNA (Uridine(2843)-N(3))-methyltransferase n=1 Tax=[Candida] railenensis TaxID=45579 RepID=A0A9P0QQI7_9ASCO|nr:25S rRNA (uridine(2843)-N(3))-methyltransferase [[Candida] railenensis]
MSADAIPFTNESVIEPRKIVDLFTTSFAQILDSEDLTEHIQSVKRELYNRDYLSAFNSDDKRLAYVARWTPARSLAYSSLFSTLNPIREIFTDSTKSSKCLCIGGGAGAELVGLASLFCRLKEYSSTSESNIEVVAIDIANWSSIVRALTNYIKHNWIYDQSKFNSTFILGDILTSTELTYSQFDLITLMFTTNELFSEKRQETIKLLQALNKNCKKGCKLLITESAGSYSNITIGTKQFPVQFLIDMVLIGKPGTNSGAWEVVEQSDSCWFRINPKDVPSYPMKLENMRFFYRLYIKK